MGPGFFLPTPKASPPSSHSHNIPSTAAAVGLVRRVNQRFFSLVAPSIFSPHGVSAKGVELKGSKAATLLLPHAFLITGRLSAYLADNGKTIIVRTNNPRDTVAILLNFALALFVSGTSVNMDYLGEGGQNICGIELFAVFRSILSSTQAEFVPPQSGSLIGIGRSGGIYAHLVKADRPASPQRIGPYLAEGAVQLFELWDNFAKNLPLPLIQISDITASILKKANVRTLGELSEYTRNQLLELPCFGENHLREVDDLLSQYGLSLKKG